MRGVWSNGVTFFVVDNTNDKILTYRHARHNSPATGAPSITGSPQVGALLSVDLTNITDANGLPTDAAEFTYQWVRVDGANEIDIGGATGSTYTPSASQEGKTLKVRVSFTDLDGYGEGPLTSAATAQVAVPGVTPSASSLTIIEGGNADYTVVLDTEPTAEVTVDIGGYIGTDLSLSHTELTFTTVNWSTPQTVTVSAAEDGDAAHDTVTLTPHRRRRQRPRVPQPARRRRGGDGQRQRRPRG